MNAVPLQEPERKSYGGLATHFGADVRSAAAEIVARYPAGRQRSALLPMLHLVQSEEGYVSPHGIAFCAETLGLTEAAVAAVATFYSMYKREPVGEYVVSVCTNTLCGMLGGDEVLEALRDELGVAENETTADGRVTLEHAECLAACDYAPVVTVNYEFFDQQSPESAVELARKVRAGELPLPTRGAPLCTFKQIERQLAGFPDERPDALAAGGAGGAPTMAGLRLAARHGMSADDVTEGTAPPSTPATGTAPADTHDTPGADAPPTSESGDHPETTTVTSAAESGEAAAAGGGDTAQKSSEHADRARARHRKES